MFVISDTVEPRYNEDLGTMEITLLYQVSPYFRVKKQRNTKSWDQQNYLVITGFCYIRPLYNEVPLYFVISVVNKQYKTKEINSLALEKLVCYIRYFVISDLFISSFHCIVE